MGLGSRVSVPDGALALYAQWAQWSDEADFTWESREDGATVTGYHGTDDAVVIPQRLGGEPVTAIAERAFDGCAATEVVFPPSIQDIARRAAMPTSWTG